ncbi:MAG: DUF4349 domain-containing protein, partial [Anaerotignaceae bacterium]
MDCNRASELMNLYIDSMINKEEKELLLQHLKACNCCAEEFEFIKDMVKSLNEEEFLPLPENYHEELMEKINETKIEKLEVAFKRKRNWRKYTTVAAAALAVIVVGGIGLNSGSLNKSSLEYGNGVSARNSMGTTDAAMQEMAVATAPDMVTTEEYSMDSNTSVEKEIYDGDATVYNEEDRKRIKSGSMSLAVDNFEETVENIKNDVSNKNGYVENYYSYVYYTDQENNISLKQGNVTIRVDKDYYEQVKGYVATLGEVESENENVLDITSQYFDTEGRLKAKRAEETRLIELLSTADNIQDIIAIEQRLAELRSDIESYEGIIKSWDKQVEFSTLSIELREKDNVKIGSIPSDFGTKIKENFIESINVLVVGFQNIVLGIVKL